MKVSVIIPFRDRGLDPRRGANLDVVVAWWYAHGFDPRVIDDGLSDDAQFNRHKAYNRAVSLFPETDVFVFTEADMLIHPGQVWRAAVEADEAPGLVVPFKQYRYLSDTTTEDLRERFYDSPLPKLSDWWSQPVPSPESVFALEPESVMDNGRSIGAVNVVSRRTLEVTGGFTEATSGNWYDDNIIEEGFAFLTGRKTRFIDGPAVHLYHLPGHKGDHLTDADKRATAHNLHLLTMMRRHIRLRQRRPVQTLMQQRMGS